jgi:cyanophycinase
VTGTIALVGGGAFTPAAELVDRRLLELSGAEEVVVLPTADAFEHPERAVASAVACYEGLGVRAEGLDVLRRADALDDALAARIAAASFVYLVGESPMHLRSVLKDTPAWDAIVAVVRNGGVVAAAGPAAAALCDPLVDPRGGAFTLGLGLITGLALVTEAETWSAERLKRTLDLVSGFAVATLPTGSALLHRRSGWEHIGPVEVHGELPET